MARRLYRSRTDRKIAGVCGGLAEYFDIDPVFVRLAMIVPLFAGVPTPLIYIVCWAALPTGTSRDPAAPGVIDLTPATSRGNGIILVGAVVLMSGLLLLAINLDLIDRDLFRWWRWKFIWPVTLIAAGVVILWKSITAGRTEHGDGGP